MGGIFRDLRLSLRQLARNPGFASSSVLTLGIGIGAATTLFGLVHAILLTPLPFPDPDRLLLLHSADPPRALDDVPVSLPDLRDWAERTQSLAALGAYSTLPSHLVLQTETAARELATTHVSSGFFEALGVAPTAGRIIGEEDELGDPRVVVVSHGFWTGQLGGDPAAVGGTLRLSDAEFRVIGVMPPGFGFPDTDTEVWTSLAVVPETSIPMQIRGVRFLEVVARMEAGVVVDQALQELSTIAAALAGEFPDSNAELRGVGGVPLREATLSGVQAALLLVFAAVGLVLLVACVNVANLVLTRGLARSREFAVRISLGAGRRQLVRMLAIDSAVLGVLGGGFGVLVAWGAIHAVRLLHAGVLPRIEEVELGPWTLLFATLVSLGALTFAGLLPALSSARVEPAQELRAGGRSGVVPEARARRGLVTAQFAASIVLLVGAGLLGRSLWELQSVGMGFEPEGALAVSLVIPQSRYPAPEDYRGFHRAALERLRTLPGVEAVGSIRTLPTRGTGESTGWSIPGEPPEVAAGHPSADVLQVTPGLLNAMRIPLIAGRDLTDQDISGSLPVTLVNEAFVSVAFPGEDPVGRAVSFAGEEWTIVGVTGDVLQRGPDSPAAPSFYVPNEQLGRRGMSFVLRTGGDAAALAPAALATFREMDPGLAVSEVVTLSVALDGSISRPRFFAVLLVLLALSTVALTAIGLNGVLAFLVRSRTSEIGIRLALGATGRQIVRLVLGDGIGPVAIGTVLGLALALAGAGLTRALLFGIEPLDPLTFLAATLLLLVVAALAMWIPARRAASMDPLAALRTE